MTLASNQLSLTINDKAIGPVAVPETMMMQDFLHEYLDLTGSRMGCGQGICHACTVIVEKDDGSLRRNAHLHHRRALVRRQESAHGGGPCQA